MLFLPSPSYQYKLREQILFETFFQQIIIFQFLGVREAIQRRSSVRICTRPLLILRSIIWYLLSLKRSRLASSLTLILILLWYYIQPSNTIAKAAAPFQKCLRTFKFWLLPITVTRRWSRHIPTPRSPVNKTS